MNKYEAKARYAERVLDDNVDTAVDNGMPEEQALVLGNLCRIRHIMHCNMDALYFSEYSYHDELVGYLEGGIHEMLDDVDLDNDLIWYTDDLDTDEVCIDLDYSEKETDEAYIAVIEFMNKVNNEIEQYLLKIDKKYKTKFCPTGHARLM